MTREQYRLYEAAVASFYEYEGIEYLASGFYKCPDCDVEFECGQCPHCLKDAGSFAVESFPSRHICECCGDCMAGDRYDGYAFSNKTNTIEEYIICPYCVYYAEYGRLDDTTMEEIDDLQDRS